MWKLAPNFARMLQSKCRLASPNLKRTFLSDSFKIENAWNDRLKSPVLQKIIINDLFYELDNQFQHFAYASALDIDLFVNAVDDESNFDEIEDLVHKLRLSPEAINILPSTHHALVRLYMKFNKTSDLMRVLDDRLNYGIFPDDYCNLLMIDTFIKEGNFRDAAKVSNFCMLQEDVSNPLIKYMSLYACHKYMDNPVTWNDVENQAVEEGGNDDDDDDDDDEEVKVRVRYIRNPYFDDHFDLVDPNHLIGKTMHYIGSHTNDNIGNSYKLIGLVLHDKLQNAKEYIDYLTSSTKSNVIFKEALDIVCKTLDEKVTSEATNETLKAQGNELKDIIKQKFSTSQLGLTSDEKLLTSVESKVKFLVNEHEHLEIKKQLEAYKQWETVRERLLMEQITKINQEKRLAEVQRQKQQIQEKEEELFFFDNQDKLDLIIEEKEKRKEEQKERERKRLEARRPPIPKKLLIQPKRKGPPEELPLETYIDENIPTKLIKTKL